MTKKYIINQKDKIITHENPNYSNAILTYCNTNKKPLECDSNNFIIVKYNNKTKYASGFTNANCPSRNEITYIINQDSIFLSDDPLIIEANTLIQIHFNSTISSMENFFNSDFDPNSQKIIYIDLSHFNSSLVNNTKNMLYNCSSLEYLDISNFNPYNLDTYDSMFYNVDNIKYIKLLNLQNIDLISQIKSTNLNTKDNLRICQNENIINNSKALYVCCDFSKSPLKSDSTNYITVKYNNKTEYLSGFNIDNCQSRNGINFIINQDSIFKSNDNLIIEANKSIEIHFNSTISSMENFFNGDLDPNSQNIIYIDFSHFNSSLVINTKNMLYNCKSLEYLDISNFDFNNIDNSDKISHILSDSIVIKYINLINVKNYDIFKKEISDNSNLNNKDDLTVCQNELIITNENAIYVCQILNFTNYITIYYGNNVIYEDGFNFNRNKSNDYRNDIEFIYFENNTYDSSSYLKIKSNSKIDIKLKPSTKSLAHFFDSNYDLNMMNVVSIDFTYFDSSLITDLNSLFKDCNSLETIIFSNFNSSLVKNMSEMFSGCSNLTEIDLSNFDTSSVIDMHYMFYGCTNLKLIDLYNITMNKIITAHNIFKNLDNIKYIDLIDVNNTFSNITETQLNRKDGLMVCQRENIITNANAKYQCCYYNTKSHICESAHYIILIFGKNLTYESGFVVDTNENNKEFRINTLFAVIKGKKIYNNDELNILSNTKIEIHFASDITSLENFFNLNYDKNMEYIEKIDFSAFNSSTVKKMSHLFDGCSSLNSIDFTNFDSSAVTDMSYMFSGCNSLEFINLSNFNTECVINMSYMFSGCDSIISFNLSNCNTKSTTDMSYMFAGCNSIISFNLSNLNTESVTNMSYMFSGCNSIISLNLSSFDTSNTIDMREMFHGCNSLEILDISNFDVPKCDLYNNMFSNYEILNILI